MSCVGSDPQRSSIPTPGCGKYSSQKNHTTCLNLHGASRRDKRLQMKPCPLSMTPSGYGTWHNRPQHFKWHFKRASAWGTFWVSESNLPGESLQGFLYIKRQRVSSIGKERVKDQILEYNRTASLLWSHLRLFSWKGRFWRSFCGGTVQCYSLGTEIQERKL